MASPFSRDGRDYYATPDGRIVSLDAGFDPSADYPDLVPATKDEVDANAYARSEQQMRGPSLRTETGDYDPDAVFGVSSLSPSVGALPYSDETIDAAREAEAQTVEQFVALPPAEPEAPKAFSRDGRDYYFDGKKLVSVDAGFDPSEDYPGLTPASAEDVRKHELQKTSGGFVSQLRNIPVTAAATVATLAEGISREANELDPRQFLNTYAPKPLTYDERKRLEAELNAMPGATPEKTAAALDRIAKERLDARWRPDDYTRKEDVAPFAFTEQARAEREANPTSSFIGAAIPDVALNFAIPGAGVEAAAARLLASAMVTEAGDAVIEGHEFDMGTALGVWAPTQLAFETAGNAAFRGAAKALGWSRNAVNAAVERARSSAVKDALRETDPARKAAKLVKHAPHVYAEAQSGLDEALSVIDERLASAPDKLFTRSALKRSVSNNINAQSDAVVDLATQVAHAAEVTGAPTLEKAARLLDGVRGSGGAVLYDALRQVRKLFDEAAESTGWAAYAVDNPLARDVVDAIDRSLVDETVWGRAARDYSNAAAEAARAGAPTKFSVRDVTAREALDARIEQARRVAGLTKDEALAKAAERAREALGTADEVTGARLLNAKATPDEIAAMRQSVDAFPDRAPTIATTVGKHIDALDDISPALFPDTWTPERIERHIALRAAGNKAAKKELDGVLDRAEKYVAQAKRTGSLTAGKAARAESQLGKLRAALEDVDTIAQSAKTIRDFDAAPRNLVERAIDTVTGKGASAIVSRLVSTASGAAAGFVGGGYPGAMVGAVGGDLANRLIEPAVRERAGKFGAWLKQSLRKHGAKGAGVGLIYGAHELATDEDDASPNAAAALGLLGAPLLFKGGGVRRLSGYKTLAEIAKEFGGEQPAYLYTLLKEHKVPSQLSPRGSGRLYDASKIGITPDGRPVVFNKKGYAQSDSRHRYQEMTPITPKPETPLGSYAEELAATRARVESVTREAGFTPREDWGRYDALPINQKALTALARKTGKAIQGLDPEEQLALLDYIEGGAARAFRSLQRGEAAPAGREHFAQSLPAFESAVEKLQREGLTEQIGPLWRGFHITPEDATRLVNSKYVETGAFTSTSFSPWTSYDIFATARTAQEMKHVPVMLKFEHVERAAPISAAGFSHQYGTAEREALLPAGSRFEVVDVTRQTKVNGGSIEVTLREVPKDKAGPIGFVLTGLLGIEAAAGAGDDDDGEGVAAAAGVGGLALLYGGRGKARLFREQRRLIGQRMPAAARAVADRYIERAADTIAKTANWAATAERGAAARATFELRNHIVDRAIIDPDIEALGRVWPNGPRGEGFVSPHEGLDKYVKAAVDAQFADAAARLPPPAPLGAARQRVAAAIEAEAVDLADAPLHKRYSDARLQGLNARVIKTWEALQQQLQKEAPPGLDDLARDYEATNKINEISNAIDEALGQFVPAHVPWKPGPGGAAPVDDRLVRAAAGDASVDLDALEVDMVTAARDNVELRTGRSGGGLSGTPRLGDFIEHRVDLAVAEAAQKAREQAASAPEGIRGMGLAVREGGADFFNEGWAESARAAVQSQHTSPERLRDIRQRAVARLHRYGIEVPKKQAEAIVDDLIDAAAQREDVALALEDIARLVNEGAEGIKVAGKHSQLARTFQRFTETASHDLGFNVQRAIDDYAGDFDYKHINKFVRTGDALGSREDLADWEEAALGAASDDIDRASRRADIQRKAERLQIALDYAVIHGYTAPGKTWRGVLMNSDELAALRSSPVAEAKSFMSTSASPDYPYEFISSKKQLNQDPSLHKVIFEVHQRTGVPVNPGEAEVLLRAGSRFRVERIDDPATRAMFRLTEINDDFSYAPSELGQRLGEKALPWVAGGALLLSAADDDGEGVAAAGAGGLVALPLLLRRGGIKLVAGDFPGNALEVLDHARRALAGRVTPAMSLRQVDTLAEDTAAAWQRDFERAMGRAPNEREAAAAHNAFAITGWQQHGKALAAKAQTASKPRAPLGLPDDDDLRNAGFAQVAVHDADGVEAVFGQPLTVKDIQDLSGIEHVARYADEAGADLDAIIEVHSGAVHIRSEAYEFHIERTYKPLRNGQGFTVRNDYFIVPDELQNEGVGKKILQNQARALVRLGARSMVLSAAWVGQYIWPKLGFRPSPSAERAAIDRFRRALNDWIGTEGADELLANVSTLRDLADATVPVSALHPTHVSNLRHDWRNLILRNRPRIKDQPFEEAFIRPGKGAEPDQFAAGKAFLLLNHGPWNNDLHIRIDETDPWWKEYTRRIGLGLALGVPTHEVLRAMSEQPIDVWTAENPWERDEREARAIIERAEEQVDAINQAREQQLDETREKLAYLSHQGKTLMQSAARTLAGPTSDTARVERIPGVTSSAGVARFLGSHSSMSEAFEEKKRLLGELQRDPMALVEELAESYGELQDTAPELHAQVTQKTFQIAAFLQTKLPPAQGVSLARPEGVSTDPLAMRQFALYYSAATDPASVVSDLANNRARREQVETLREVWPETYQSLKLAVLERMSEKRPTVEQRMRLDLLFDFGPQFDRAFSPELVAALGAYRQAAGPGNGHAAPPTTPSRRTQGSITAAGALPQLTLGPAAGPGTLA